MQPYKVAEARAAFGDLLDAAERGEAVVIERRGVEFILRPQRTRRRAPRRSPIQSVDSSILDGQWTWAWDRGGIKLRTRGKRP